LHHRRTEDTGDARDAGAATARRDSVRPIQAAHPGVGIVMAVTASAALISELDKVIKAGSASRQTRILRQVTDLFRTAVNRLDETQTDVFDEVLARLIESADLESLTNLSVILSGIEMAPRETVGRLASHEEASVAAPVLANSNRLSETHLIEIARTRGRQHLLAISARRALDEMLTDALIRRGDSEVFKALAKNAGARFSETGYAVLVGNAERDESLLEGLGLRLDIPAKLLRRVLGAATDAVWARLSNAARPVVRDRPQLSSVAGAAASGPTDYSQAIEQMVALNRAGKLNDSPVNRFAIRGEYTHVVSALSFMTDVKVEEIEPLIQSDRLYGLIVACRAARLDWATTSTIIRYRPGCPVATRQELERAQEIFEALLLSVAQWTVRFGLARNTPEKIAQAARG
jgi:hypothetical protein